MSNELEAVLNRLLLLDAAVRAYLSHLPKAEDGDEYDWAEIMYWLDQLHILTGEEDE